MVYDRVIQNSMIVNFKKKLKWCHKPGKNRLLVLIMYYLNNFTLLRVNNVKNLDIFFDHIRLV